MGGGGGSHQGHLGRWWRPQSARSHLLRSWGYSSELQPGRQRPGTQVQSPRLWQRLFQSMTRLGRWSSALCMASISIPSQRWTISVALPQTKQPEKSIQLGRDGNAKGHGAQRPVLHTPDFQEHRGLHLFRGRGGEQESGLSWPASTARPSSRCTSPSSESISPPATIGTLSSTMKRI